MLAAGVAIVQVRGGHWHVPWQAELSTAGTAGVAAKPAPLPETSAPSAARPSVEPSPENQAEARAAPSAPTPESLAAARSALSPAAEPKPANQSDTQALRSPSPDRAAAAPSTPAPKVASEPAGRPETRAVQRAPSPETSGGLSSAAPAIASKPASPAGVRSPPSAAPANTQVSAVPAPPLEAAVKPSFDIVRVDAEGVAVIAGRAAPGAEVTIRDDGRELGQIKADLAGQWVLLPATPLSVGSRELTLSERTREGGELKADATVLLVVPDRKREMATNPVPPLAVLTPEIPSARAPVRLLQPPPPVGLGAGAHLGLDAVQYDDHGAISFAGGGPPGAAVRIYVDNRKIGDATTDTTGRWSLVPTVPIAIGRHRVRVDQLNPNGRVAARVELPFSRESAPESTVAQGRVVVQPGETLWRLARHVYGSGMRYTVIYQANREQIRDPRLIYPGQTFAVPEAQPTSSPPDKSG